MNKLNCIDKQIMFKIYMAINASLILSDCFNDVEQPSWMQCLNGYFAWVMAAHLSLFACTV